MTGAGLGCRSGAAWVGFGRWGWDWLEQSNGIGPLWLVPARADVGSRSGRHGPSWGRVGSSARCEGMRGHGMSGRQGLALMGPMRVGLTSRQGEIRDVREWEVGQRGADGRRGAPDLGRRLGMRRIAVVRRRGRCRNDGVRGGPSGRLERVRFDWSTGSDLSSAGPSAGLDLGGPELGSRPG